MATSEPRTLILSDLHLGCSFRAFLASPSLLRPAWQGFDRLVFNGDIAELDEPGDEAEARRLLDEMRAQLEADGVEPVFLAGNHDPSLSDRQYVELLDGRVLVTHGDVFHLGISPWCPRAAELRALHAEARAAMDADQRDTRAGRFRSTAIANRRLLARPKRGRPGFSLRNLLHKPWAPAKVLWSWARYPAFAADFTRAYFPEASCVVFGHIHRAGVWRRQGVDVINTGCFGFPSRPLGVVVEGESVTVHELPRQAGVYHLAADASATIELPPPAPRPVDRDPELEPLEAVA